MTRFSFRALSVFALAGVALSPVRAQDGPYIAPSWVLIPSIANFEPSADLSAPMEKARMAIAERRYADAGRLLAPLLGRSYGNPTVYLLGGLAYLGQGHIDKASRLVETAVHLAPRDISANHGLALVRIASGDNDGAMRILDRLKARADKCHGRCGDAKVLDDAIGSIQRAAKIS